MRGMLDKSVRFANHWRIGVMECWSDGVKRILECEMGNADLHPANGLLCYNSEFRTQNSALIPSSRILGWPPAGKKLPPHPPHTETDLSQHF